jgi:hypothetical protein
MTRHNDIEREEQLREAEERIKREVIIVDASDEENTEDDEDEERDEENQEVKPKREKTWMLFTTGGILTEGTLPYYRYFIAIAVMCFFSIFLTFMSLNANREYRRREKYASVLHERSVLKEELRYSLSSKSVVTERLKSYNIELVDLSKDSRLIEK